MQLDHNSVKDACKSLGASETQTGVEMAEEPVCLPRRTGPHLRLIFNYRFSFKGLITEEIQLKGSSNGLSSSWKRPQTYTDKCANK